MSETDQSAGGSARITCTKCGANNYVGTAYCWQCGKPITSRPNTEHPIPALYPSLKEGNGPVAQSQSVRSISTEPIILPRESFDPDLAQKAAVAMGLLFPFIGLPAGMIFLMLDDARKARIGWVMIGWSLLGTVGGLILSVLASAPILALLKGFAPHAVPDNSLNSPDMGG